MSEESPLSQHLQCSHEIRDKRIVHDHRHRVVRQREMVSSATLRCKLKVKEADLYSAFIEVDLPYTQGAQVQITQCYLQITPYLPLPRKHSPDGASQTEVADICLLLIYLPGKDERLSWPGWLVT